MFSSVISLLHNLCPKAVLAWVWFLSSVYGILCDQLLTKVVDKPCDVREEIRGTLGYLSVVVGLIVPFVVGE